MDERLLASSLTRRDHRTRWAREGGALDGRSNAEKRLDRIEAALASEKWLPLGLRSLVAEELPALREALSEQRGASARAAAAASVHELALASYCYGPKLLDSELVTQLRVLDLELNPPRLDEGRDRRPAFDIGALEAAG